VQHRERDVPQRERFAIPRALEPEGGTGTLVQHVGGAGGLGERTASGDMVRVQMGIDHETDRCPFGLGGLQYGSIGNTGSTTAPAPCPTQPSR